jgi:hypothetical protein
MGCSLWDFKSGFVLNSWAVNYSAHPISEVLGQSAEGRLFRPLAERAASRRSEAKLLASLKPASTLATACATQIKNPAQ